MNKYIYILFYTKLKTLAKISVRLSETSMRLKKLNKK